MEQDYRNLSDEEIEAVEKQTLRVIVQALQEYSREAREIFDNTQAPSKNEVIVLAEDLVQYALEVAEVYPINKRFAGFIDYKRVRWLPTPFGLLPQVLLAAISAQAESAPALHPSGCFRKCCWWMRRHPRRTTAKRSNCRNC